MNMLSAAVMTSFISSADRQVASLQEDLHYWEHFPSN
jgi:hypothetical protein